MIKIGGKIIRNIPEQVAKNSVDIEQLKKYQYQAVSAEIVAGHLILTLANGDEIDCGVVKGISYMNIDGSQHLIAHYNDGTSEDLGAIFQGNVNISGDLTADSIIENMTGYSFTNKATSNSEYDIDYVYVGAVKNGNKLTLTIAIDFTRLDTVSTSLTLGKFIIPEDVGQKLFPSEIGDGEYLSLKQVEAFQDENTAPIGINSAIYKGADTELTSTLKLQGLNNLTLNTKYYIRMEATFLLSDDLAA